MLRTLIRCGAVAGLSTWARASSRSSTPTAPRPFRSSSRRRTENFWVPSSGAGTVRLHGTTANIWGMANVMSFRHFSTLSNNCQGQRVGIPRPGNDNAVGNARPGAGPGLQPGQ